MVHHRITMSSLCPASAKILTIYPEDLDPSNMFNRGKILQERVIDIRLQCTYTVEAATTNEYTLRVDTWSEDTADLCGLCSFCVLLADNLRVSFHSTLREEYTWLLGAKLALNRLSQPLTFESMIQFTRLEYQKDHRLRKVDRDGHRTRDCTGDVHLLVLGGSAFLFSDYEEHIESTKRFKLDVAFELFKEDDDPTVNLLQLHRRPLDELRLSKRNVATILKWMKECDDQHEACGPDFDLTDPEMPAGTAAFLPTRLIDVGDDQQSPRLLITSEMRPSQEELRHYMALSYCWGPIDEDSKLLTTTFDTLDSRTDSIPLAMMPQTFQEAIAVARALCVQYLWIDSLCIIQDDFMDWQRESSKMAEIFSNAYLTLASATGGGGCNDSFLRKDLPNLSCTIPVSVDAGYGVLHGKISLRARRRCGGSEKMSDIGESRWITRG
jgi:hypothetical protein